MIKALRSLISDVNQYRATADKENRKPSPSLLKQIALYVNKILQVFGLHMDEEKIGFPAEGFQSQLENAVMPGLMEFAARRENVRKIALDTKDKPILQACDLVRDQTLPDLGVRLEDKENGWLMRRGGGGVGEEAG